MTSFALNTFLRNYYLSSFFYKFVFAHAIYTVFFFLTGLSVFQISLLMSIEALAIVLLEIPSGALADSWSRRKMLTIAPLFKSICLVIWFFAQGNFYLYAVGFFFSALGSSFVSGTKEALLYDTLTYTGNKDDYEKVLGKSKSFQWIAISLATISGGFLASYKLDWAIIFSIVPLTLSTLFAFRLKEVPKVETTGEVHYLEYINIACKEIKTNRVFLYLLAYLLAISVFSSIGDFDQLYYQLVNLPIFAFGIVGFLGSVFSAIGTYYAYKLKRFAPYFYMLPFISGILLVFVAIYPSVPMIILLLSSYSIASSLTVLIESNLQHSIISVSRATITSASKFCINILFVIAAPVFGLIANVWNLQAIYLIAGVFVVFFAVLIFILRNNVTVKTANNQY